MDGSENPPESYDFDLIIIGGGSGGLAAAKARALCAVAPGQWLGYSAPTLAKGAPTLVNSAPSSLDLLRTGCVFPINLGKTYRGTTF